MLIADLQTIVANRYGITKADILSATTRRKTVLPRWIAMYAARYFLGNKWSHIGRHFKRDHATISHACMRIDQFIAADPRWEAEVDACLDMIEDEAERKKTAALFHYPSACS